MAAQHHECSEQEIDFLFRVIDEGKIEFVRWAMEQGVDPNLESPKSGATLLTEAISALQPAIVELLGQYGADPEFADDEGITPLELAQKTGNPAMIACLEKAAAEAKSDDEEEDAEEATEESTEDLEDDSDETTEDDEDEDDETSEDDCSDEEEDSDEKDGEADEDETPDIDLSLIQVKPLSDETYYNVMSRISQMAIDRTVLLGFLKAQHCRTAEEALEVEDGTVAENYDLYRALKLFADTIAEEE